MTKPDLPFAQEAYELMGAAFEVHNLQGGGLSEGIYQESLDCVKYRIKRNAN